MTEENHDEYQVCYRHPDRKTLLRCNKCGRPICLECAVQTPTGYRCKECIKSQQKVFDTTKSSDYPVGAVIAAVLGLAGAIVFRLIPILPGFVSALIFGTAFGKIICKALRAAVNKRRSDRLTKTVVTAAGLGALAVVGPELFVYVRLLFSGQAGLFFGGLTPLLSDVIYIAVLCLTIRSELTGMVFRR